MRLLKSISLWFLTLVIGMLGALLVAQVLLGGPAVGTGWRCSHKDREHLKSLGPILERFHNDTGRWPRYICELYPNYVDDYSKLVCPADSSQLLVVTELEDKQGVRQGVIICRGCLHNSVRYEQPILLRTVIEHSEPQVVIWPDGRMSIRPDVEYREVRPIWDRR